MALDIVTRFAPSPTGRLHLGHAYSAMLSHDAGTRFLLRIEDIDAGRCRPEFVEGIYEDLRWLGLDWDGMPMIQSERMPAYAEALAKLDDMGVLYRCICKRSDIAAAIEAPQGPMGAIYPGTCRGQAIELNQPWSWRLDVAKALALTGPLMWHDTDAGEVTAQPELLGDVVLARKDAGTSYHLAVTLDDAAQGITLAVRGRDLFAATHIHRLLQALLDLPVPRYFHHPLIIGADGERLAKRKHAPTIASMREAGVDPARLMADLLAGRFPVGFALSGS